MTMPYPPDSEWPRIWVEFHAWIDTVSARAPRSGMERQCEHCGTTLRLVPSRRGAFFWYHERLKPNLLPSLCRVARAPKQYYPTAEEAAAGPVTAQPSV